MFTVAVNRAVTTIIKRHVQTHILRLRDRKGGEHNRTSSHSRNKRERQLQTALRISIAHAASLLTCTLEITELKDFIRRYPVFVLRNRIIRVVVS
jgi:hypothetical protein